MRTEEALRAGGQGTLGATVAAPMHGTACRPFSKADLLRSTAVPVLPRRAHLTRVAWIARKTPRRPAMPASGVAPSYADSPEMANRPSGTLKEGVGTTVGRVTLGACLTVFFAPPKLNSCQACSGHHVVNRHAPAKPRCWLALPVFVAAALPLTCERPASHAAALTLCCGGPTHRSRPHGQHPGPGDVHLRPGPPRNTCRGASRGAWPKRARVRVCACRAPCQPQANGGHCTLSPGDVSAGSDQ